MACLASSMMLEARPAFALSLSSSQPVIKQTLAPGETVQGSIELSNYPDESLKLRVYLQDWRYKATGDGEKDFSPPQTMPRSAAGWVSFFPAEVELPQHGKAVIDYTIRVPDDASLNGEYTTVVFFEALLAESPAGTKTAPSDKTSGNVLFAARLGSLFYVDVKGTVRKEGRLSEVMVSRATAAAPATAQAKLSNEGNAVLLCEGAFHVIDANNVMTDRGQLPTRWVWPGDQVPLTVELGESAAGTLVLTYDCGEDVVIVEETPLSGS